MMNEFIISNYKLLYSESFKILKYLDAYGNTIFNAMMFKDLIADLEKLKIELPKDSEQIEKVIGFAIKCSNELHTYLKFCGD